MTWISTLNREFRSSRDQKRQSTVKVNEDEGVQQQNPRQNPKLVLKEGIKESDRKKVGPSTEATGPTEHHKERRSALLPYTTNAS